MWNRRFEIAFALAAGLAVTLVLYLGRWLTFYHDEWTFIGTRGDWTLDVLMEPHNEHLALGLALVYKALLSTVGLRSYLPYLLVLVLLHVATAAGLFRLLTWQSGPVFALAGSTLVLFLGSGYENLFWAFQIGWVGSVTAGTWALALLLLPVTTRRLVLSAILLLVSVASMGTGLFFLAAALVMLLADPKRRRQLSVLAPASVAYGVWYALVGHEAVAVNRDPFTFESIGHLPDYVTTGISNAIGVISGTGQTVGLVIFVILAVATAWHLIGNAPLRAAAVAGFVGLVAQFALTGLVRVGQSTSSRYVYTAAIFLLIAFSGWVGKRLVGSGLRGHATLVVLWAGALLANGSMIWAGREVFEERAQQTRAAITLLERYGGSPAIPANEPFRIPGLIPGRETLDEIFAVYGSPMRDAFLGPAPSPPGRVLDDVLYQLVAGRFTIAAQNGPSDLVGRAEIAHRIDLSVERVGSCVDLRPSGLDPQAILEVPAGSALSIRAVDGGEVQAFLGLFDVPSEANSQRFMTAPQTTYVLETPDIGHGAVWLLRLDPPPNTTTRVCGESPTSA